jgi:hypothetical protein
MADKDIEIKAEDVNTNEQNDANEDVRDLEPEKDVTGGGGNWVRE